jgi:hypothetical protein
MLGGGDPDRAGGLVAEFAQRDKPGIDLLECRPQRTQQALSGIGRGDAARRAGEEPESEARLEPANRVAQG